MKLTDMSERLLLIELVKLMRKNVKQGEWVMERIKERINEDNKKSFQQKEKELKRIADALEVKNEIDKKTLSYIKATNEMGKKNLEMHKEIFALDKKIREYSVQKIASEINNKSEPKVDDFSKKVEKASKRKGELSETELRLIMQHPKYWKEQDPETVKRVEEGFKRLYGY